MHTPWSPGKTADPGLIAHFTVPIGLRKESVWLAYYVILSRPRSLATLLCHSMPDRSIIEGGPPDAIPDALMEFFADKITATAISIKSARRELGWPRS